MCAVTTFESRQVYKTADVCQLVFCEASYRAAACSDVSDENNFRLRKLHAL